MERVTRKQLQNLTGQLAAACGKKWGKTYKTNEDGSLKRDDSGRPCPVVGCWYLDVMNPGDGTTYAIEEMSDGGGASRPLGECRHTAREMASALRVALDAVRLAIGEDEFSKRVSAYWKTQKQD